MTAEKGLVFNIQKYCVHNGPGIRSIVFYMDKNFVNELRSKLKSTVPILEVR